MGRLFWKVFLGFWLTTAIVIVATVVVLSLLVERADPERQRARQEARLETSAVTAQLLLQRGREELTEWLAEQNERGRNPLWLVGPDNRDVLGRPIPQPVRRALRSGRLDRFSATVTAPDGTAYRLFAPPPQRDKRRDRPGILAIGLPLAVLISGLVCWLLARHLARPVHHLQSATRRLADGELDVRVGPAIGRRRDEIAALGTDFDRMAERLQELLNAQRRLLRDVSHELRTPLARLHVALGLARQRGQGVDAELDRIELEASRLGELIDELLTVMRLQSGTDTPNFTTVDISGLLAEVVDDAQLEAAGKPCRLETDLAAGVQGRGDRELLRRAVENILRNAIRHTAPDTVVAITLQQQDTISITIHDQGPGVPEAELSRLFEPFVRVEGARERQTGGYGLGLAIAQQAIRVHNGTLTASNAAGGGLEVVIELPATD